MVSHWKSTNSIWISLATLSLSTVNGVEINWTWCSSALIIFLIARQAVCVCYKWYILKISVQHFLINLEFEKWTILSPLTCFTHKKSWHWIIYPVFYLYYLLLLPWSFNFSAFRWSIIISVRKIRFLLKVESARWGTSKFFIVMKNSISFLRGWKAFQNVSTTQPSNVFCVIQRFSIFVVHTCYKRSNMSLIQSSCTYELNAFLNYTHNLLHLKTYNTVLLDRKCNVWWVAVSLWNTEAV